MAKLGQHNDDARVQDRSRGHNNPSKSMTITAGTPKHKETYAEQAREHRDPAPPAQAARNDWQRDPHAEQHDDGARERSPRSGRSGSDSDASH
ncbi:MAG TPA: hypothetical protein VFD32_15095 [Dehalococcoidia bacterium]|nr:hypothetical protein [Dehalococcoidia bacterium]